MKTKTLLTFSIAFLTAITSFAQTARVQVVHNSPDPLAASVDIWLNNTPLLTNFNYREASPFIDAPAAVDFDIRIKGAGSSDTLNPVAKFTYNLMENETYLLVADGFIDGTGFNPAPAFDIYVVSGVKEMASESENTDVLVYHGSTDAPTVDIYENSVGELLNDVPFSAFSSYLNLPTSDYILEVRDETGASIVARYDAPLEALNLQDSSIVVLASGFLDPSANNDGSPFGLFVALPEGRALIPLPVSDKVFDIVLNSEPHSTLETAIMAAELKDDLSSDGPFTVFAPVDAAFDALTEGTLTALLEDPTGELAEILTYHVVSGSVLSGALVDGMKVKTLQGDSIMIGVDGANVTVNGANVIIPDLEAQNGVVHVIDAVLLPPSDIPTNTTNYNSSDFNIYPNPANNYINVSLSQNDIQTGLAEIYDLTGRLIITNEINTASSIINIANLQNGMYLIRLKVGSDFYVRKFEVNNF